MKERIISHTIPAESKPSFDVQAEVTVLREKGHRQPDVFEDLSVEERRQVFDALKQYRDYHSIVYNASFFDDDLTDVLREATIDDWIFMTHVAPSFVPDRYHSGILREVMTYDLTDSEWRRLISNASYMHGLTVEDYGALADRLLFIGQSSVLVSEFDKFKGLDPHEWVKKCLPIVIPHVLFQHLDKFPGVATLDFARACVERGISWATELVYYIHLFDSSLHPAIFHLLATTVMYPVYVPDFLPFPHSDQDFAKRRGSGFQGLGIAELEQLDRRAFDINTSYDNPQRREKLFDRFIANKDSFGSLTDQEAVDFWHIRGLDHKVIGEFSKFNGPFNRETSLWFLRNIHLGHPLELVLTRQRSGMLDVSVKEIFDVWWNADHPSNEHDILAAHLDLFAEFLDDDRLRTLSRWGHSLYVGSLVAKQYDRYDQSTHPAIAHRLFDLGASRYVRFAERQYDFNVSDDELALHLADDGEVMELINGKNRFFSSYEQKADLARRIMACGAYTKLLTHIDDFVHDSQRQRVDWQALVRGCMEEHRAEVIKNPQRKLDLWNDFPLQNQLDFLLKMVRETQPNDDFAVSLIEDGHTTLALQWYRHSTSDFAFDAVQGKKILDALLGRNSFSLIARHIDLFGSVVDHNDIVSRFLQRNTVGHLDVFYSLDYLSGLHDGTAQLFLGNADGVKAIVEHPDAFVGLSDITIERVLSLAVDHGFIVQAIAFNRRFGFPDAVLDRLDKAFGSTFSRDVYDVAQRILTDDQPNVAAYQREIGFKITLGGVQGLNQFIMGLRGLRSKIVHGIMRESDVRTDFQMRWLADVARLSESEWGDDNFSHFTELVRGYFARERLVTSGGFDVSSFAPLPEGFMDSSVMHIGKLDERASRGFEYSEGFLLRYDDVWNSILQAFTLVKEDTYRDSQLAFAQRGLGKLLTQMRSTVDMIVRRLDEDRTETLERARVAGKSVERVQAAYDTARDELARLDFERMSHPQDMFLSLRRYREFDEPLRQLMFYFALLKYPDLTDDIERKNWADERPTRGDISWLMNVVQHITHQETIAPLVTDGHARKELSDLLSVEVLKQEYDRWQRHLQGTIGTSPVQMRFQRNLLTELSGYMGDACWAPSEDGSMLGESDILARFPHFTSFTLIGNPGHPRFERFVGAGLIIDAKNTDGEDVMIIRGNNPIENFINQVDAFDFLLQQMRHFQQIADARRARLAIVIDYQGGAGTNRPALQSVYDILKLELLSINDVVTIDSVKLADEPSTSFNGYDLDGITYYVSLRDVENVVSGHRGKLQVEDRSDHEDLSV